MVNADISSMKVAITEWRGRVAPLFDVAGHILVCESEGYGNPLLISGSLYLNTTDIKQKIADLRKENIETIICGAISSEYEKLLLDAGFEIFGFVAADYKEVLEAWTKGILKQQRRYSMPGCRCPRHRRGRNVAMGSRRRFRNGQSFRE